MIYSKGVFALSLLPGTEPLDPRGFLDENSNHVAFLRLMTRLLDHTKAVARAAELEVVGAFSPTPGRGRGWRPNQSPGADELINHAHVLKPSLEREGTSHLPFRQELPRWEGRTLTPASMPGPGPARMPEPVFPASP